jgi:Glycosyltransferase family 92
MTNNAMKSIVIPDKIESLYLHFAMYCRDGSVWCKKHTLPENVSLVYHFRSSLLHDSDKITKEDLTMWKYKDELIEAVAETLKATGFKP